MASRMSVKERIQVIAAASSSSTSMNRPSSGSGGSPASSRVSMTVDAAPALPSRRVALGEAAELPRRLLVVGVRRREEPASTGSSGAVVGPVKSSSSSSGSLSDGGDRRLVAQQLDQLGREGAQQVGLEDGEGGDARPAAPVSLEPRHPGASAFCIVAHRPYSCIAWTSRSISSRLPVETTERPSTCTSIISFSAFFLA